MTNNKDEIIHRVKKAVFATVGKKIDLKETDSFVANLGFNSLKMVSLTLALEEEFERPLLLNDWISQCDDPRLLTVHSLCDYIHELLSHDGG